MFSLTVLPSLGWITWDAPFSSKYHWINWIINECAIRVDKFEKDCDIFTMIASVLAILFLCYVKEGVEASNWSESSNTAVQRAWLLVCGTAAPVESTLWALVWNFQGIVCKYSIFKCRLKYRVGPKEICGKILLQITACFNIILCILLAKGSSSPLMIVL